MSKLIPYETIVKAHEGEPDEIDTSISHYAGYIQYFSQLNVTYRSAAKDSVNWLSIADALNVRF